ncbi:hypothetical protein [Streptomyces sp. x-80]|uniref:hypothetical protein n=1 Tax=Streptomyces sp. x-80 TaxID=2789282 RepID=UPI00398057AD
MRRATPIAVAATVATAASAALLIFALVPSRPGSAPGGTGVTAVGARTGHAGPGVRTAGTVPAAGGRSPADYRAAPAPRAQGSFRAEDAAPMWWIEVTAPLPADAAAGFRMTGSITVAWRNGTGRSVDVWLDTDTGGAEPERLAKVAPRAGSGPAGELLVTLPRVSPGAAYSLEVATDDGMVRDFSPVFALTR